MRPTSLALTLAILATPVLADPLPVDPDLPASIKAAELDRGLHEGSTGWIADLNGDGREDRLVNSSYAFEGGNALWAATTAYFGVGDGSFVPQSLELNRHVRNVDQDGAVFTLNLTKLLEGEPRCCPTGIEPVRYQFQ